MGCPTAKWVALAMVLAAAACGDDDGGDDGGSCTPGPATDCGGPGPGGSAGDGDDGPSGYPPALPLDSRYTSCAAAEDCVPVELGCCDACNGGLAVAVHRDMAAEAMSRFGEQCAGVTACTEIGCPAWETRCDGGSCAMEREFFEIEPAPEP